MPNTVLQNRKSFEENIGLLYEELELAIKWERPSILLAIYKSKLGQDKADKALEEKLIKLGRSITRIVVNNERPDVPHSILATSASDQAIFFVSNIDWGGGNDGKDAYRALNIYRELIVENQIKVVLWLTPAEAANLPRYAPDFWAFRHRVIEFPAQRTFGKVNVPAGILIWQVQESTDSFDKPEQRVAAREEILAKLPQSNESISTRIDLLYNIGYLYWFLGNSARASDALTTGLNLAQDHDFTQIKSRLLNGRAIISYEANQYDRAIEFCKQAIVNSPGEYSLLINLSAACCALGRNLQAITSSKRAIRMDPTDALIWNRAGYIYCAMRKIDEAIAFFKKAIELAPKAVTYLESLAVGYSIIERLDESKRFLGIARKLVGKQATFRLDIYEEAISGNIDESLKLLQKALQSDQISINEIKRDPNLNLLLDLSQLKALSNQIL